MWALRQGALVVAAAVMVAACSADAPRTRDCAPLGERWVVPPAPALGLPSATLAGDVVDPAPLIRGEHPALRLSDGADCAVVTRALDHVPMDDTPRDAAIGAPDGVALAGLDALVVTGADLGAEADARAWDAALVAIGARGRRLHAPPRATVESSITSMCVGLDDGVFVLVLTGPGTAAGGGALVLGPEAVSYERVLALVAEACHGVRLAIVVIDASYAERAIATAATPSMIIWSASSREAPEAARVALGGGGALSSALASALVERGSGCAQSAEPGQLAWLFREGGVRAELLAERWAQIGVAALERAPDTPTARAAIAHVLEQQVPKVLRRTYGALPTPGRCAGDDDCAALDDRCVADACSHFGCVAGECVAVPALGRPCDDLSPCTSDDACDARGACTGSERQCDDGDPCTTDGCDGDRGCVTEPAVGLACDDHDPCTTDDACDASGACVGAARVCDDGDPCTTDSCAIDNGGCVFVAANLACDDGDPCTFQDQCRNRICAGTPRACSDGNDCTADGCDAATGACLFVPLADGAFCDDDDACTTLDRCRAGACVGQARTCDDGLACTFDACDAGTCTHLPTPGTCLSASGCIPVGASPSESPCLVCAATDRLVAANDGQACADDGVACTSDVCAAGVCRHRDAPDQCHDADGRCVGVGERVGSCLVCAGGGIVTPLMAGTTCGGPESCEHGSCDGLGFCSNEAPPCCAPLTLACGEVRVVTAAELDGASQIDQWSCLVDETPGPERSIDIVAPCDGMMAVTLTATEPDAGDGLILTDASACPTSSCSAAGPTHTLAIAAQQVVHLAIEVARARSWVFSSVCTCDEVR